MRPIVTLIEPPALGLRVTTKEGDGFELPTVRTHHPKLQLEILAGALKALPCEVQIMDMKLLGEDQVIYKKFEHDGLQYECRRIGAPFEEITEIARSSDVIGISSPFTQAAQIVADLGRYIKQANPKVRLVVGGYDTLTDDRQAFYCQSGFDQVIPRKGEVEFPRWIASQFNLPLPSRGSVRILFDDPIEPAKRLVFPLPDLSKVRYRSYVETEDGKLPEGASYPIEYFVSSKGCDRACSYCAICKEEYDVMDVRDIDQLLGYFRERGIRTLLHAESNLMARLRYGQPGRSNLIETMRLMRKHGFAWEFFDGIEFGRLLDERGSVDDELIKLLFNPETRGNKMVGGYRAYIPVETAKVERFSKLPPLKVQDKIFEAIVKSGVRQLSFGLILGFPDESCESVEQMRRRVAELRAIVEKASNGKAKALFILYVHSLFPGSVIYRRLHETLTVDITEHPINVK